MLFMALHFFLYLKAPNKIKQGKKEEKKPQNTTHTHTQKAQTYLKKFRNQEIPVCLHLTLTSFYTDKNTFFNSLNTYYILKHYTEAGLFSSPADSFIDDFQNRYGNTKQNFKIYYIPI